MGQLVRWYTHALVPDGHYSIIIVVLCLLIAANVLCWVVLIADTYLHNATLRAVLDRVRNEIVEDLFKAGGVPLANQLWGLGINHQPVFLCLQLMRLCYMPGQGNEVYAYRRKAERLPRREILRHGEVFDELIHLPRRLGELGQIGG